MNSTTTTTLIRRIDTDPLDRRVSDVRRSDVTCRRYLARVSRPLTRPTAQRIAFVHDDDPKPFVTMRIAF